jgi:N-methylhydantoinase A/oxoprolinase/acetone carboxylase beta subunit
VTAFPEEHRRRNGFTIDDATVEVVALRASARLASPVDLADLPPVGRQGRHVGPVSIAEDDCTIWVAAGWVADVHSSGSWVLRREGAA